MSDYSVNSVNRVLTELKKRVKIEGKKLSQKQAKHDLKK